MQTPIPNLNSPIRLKKPEKRLLRQPIQAQTSLNKKNNYNFLPIELAPNKLNYTSIIACVYLTHGERDNRLAGVTACVSSWFSLPKTYPIFLLLFPCCPSDFCSCSLSRQYREIALYETRYLSISYQSPMSKFYWAIAFFSSI